MSGPVDGKDPRRVRETPANGDQTTMVTPRELAGDRTESLSERTLDMVSKGSVIADRYKVLRFIAQGGMGEVYEVEDRALDTRVALKTIRPGMAGDEDIVARFKREIHLARQVSHPNVCRIFDLGMHGGSGVGSEIMRRIAAPMVGV